MNAWLDWAAHGLIGAGIGTMLVYTLLSTHLTVACASLFLHREQTHRSIDLHPLPRHLCRLWLWLATGIETAAFVAVHRLHHAACDTADDPHSPQVHGMRAVLLRGSELYRRAAGDPRVLARYGGGTPDDALERRLYARHPNAGIALLLLVDLALFGVAGLAVWAAQMLWMPVFAAGVLNAIGHGWGWRNRAVGDTSHNFLPWGLLLCGEELHNNHHAHPGSATFALRGFEFDPGWFYIRVLARLGLARVRGVATLRDGTVAVS